VQASAKKVSWIVAAVGLALAGTAQAFDFGNMMNPSKWMGGDNDRYDDYRGGYGYPGYGYGGYPGYGGYGGYPGYGGYGGYPGYGGYGGYPGYGGYGGYGGSPVVIMPQNSPRAPEREIR
jgi:hypothetical protein